MFQAHPVQPAPHTMRAVWSWLRAQPARRAERCLRTWGIFRW